MGLPLDMFGTDMLFLLPVSWVYLISRPRKQKVPIFNILEWWKHPLHNSHLWICYPRPPRRMAELRAAAERRLRLGSVKSMLRILPLLQSVLLQEIDFLKNIEKLQNWRATNYICLLITIKLHPFKKVDGATQGLVGSKAQKTAILGQRSFRFPECRSNKEPVQELAFGNDVPLETWSDLRWKLRIIQRPTTKTSLIQRIHGAAYGFWFSKLTWWLN